MTTMTAPKILLALLVTAFALAPSAGASQQGDPPDGVPYAFRLDDPSAERVPAVSATPGEIAAAVLTLCGFLGLIAGNLVRWSGDVSWKERSVFSSRPPGE